MIRLCEVSPKAAVTEAWREVELATMDAAERAGLHVPGRIAGIRSVRQLRQKGVVSDNALGLYDRMRRLRNAAAHEPEYSIDTAEAERYVELAFRLATNLRFAGNVV